MAVPEIRDVKSARRRRWAFAIRSSLCRQRFELVRVFKMAFAFQRLGIFVAAEDVFVELHIDAAEGLEKLTRPCRILCNFFSKIIGIDVDADRPHYAVFFANNRDGRALESARAEMQLVV